MHRLFRGPALVLALLLTFFAAPVAALAEEKIAGFTSTIFVKQDGTIDVVERIWVDAENMSIRHGIYRDFPTRYTIPNGGRMKVGFTFVEARLDSLPVPHEIENQFNGVRIKLGSPDSYVSPGRHLYLIHYRVTRELGYFEDYDELYWNVTGNGWMFPIDQAGVQIHLPKPVQFGQRAFYTGPQGSTDGATAVIEEKPGQITIITTRPLAPYEGLTVAVAFPKGVVDPPRETQKLGWWLTDMLPMALAGLTLAGVIGFLFYAFRRAGRDPAEGTVVPLFAPPDDLSPAGMRYLVEQGFDNRAFAAALIDAGVKGHVILGEDKGFLFFGGEKFIEGTTGAKAPLPPAEQAAISLLVGPGEKLELDNKNHSIFSAAKKKIEAEYKSRFEGKMFHRNRTWVGIAVIIWLAGAYLVALALVIGDDSIPTPIVFAAPIAGAIAFALHRFAKSSENSTGSCLFNILALFVGFGALGLTMLTLASAFATLRWQPMLLVALGLPIALSSLFWISAPTKEGRAMLDRIAGFKHYLSITEADRLDRMQAPRDTLQMFERWLPYAVALEVENRWADRFEGQLAAAAAAGQQGFVWYNGSHSPWTDTGGFVSSIGSSLSNSISSASTAPGSSSGSGGGGSSGGGGGGGGGGGW
ncbi:MAG: DUF2207 domain-containing protein [Sphingomicrobium sp.]